MLSSIQYFFFGDQRLNICPCLVNIETKKWFDKCLKATAQETLIHCIWVAFKTLNLINTNFHHNVKSNQTNILMFTDKRTKENWLISYILVFQCISHWGSRDILNKDHSIKTLTHLALARDGLIEKQATAVLLVQTGVFGPCGATSHTAQTGHTERFEAIGRERRRRCGRVRLVARGRPAPVAPRRAVAWRGKGASWAVILPRTAQPFWEDRGEKKGEQGWRGGKGKGERKEKKCGVWT